jgi:hypothetical protein
MSFIPFRVENAKSNRSNPFISASEARLLNENGSNKTRKRRKKARKIKKQPSTNILFWSSLVFVTNMFAAFWRKYYLYSLFFACLTISSLVVHSHHTLATNLIDKVCIAAIVLYGGYMFYIKLPKINLWNSLFYAMCVSTFLFTIWVYIYGYITKQYCFCGDSELGNIWHSMMHVVSSIGHHFIIGL